MDVMQCGEYILRRGWEANLVMTYYVVLTCAVVVRYCTMREETVREELKREPWSFSRE